MAVDRETGFLAGVGRLHGRLGCLSPTTSFLKRATTMTLSHTPRDDVTPGAVRAINWPHIEHAKPARLEQAAIIDASNQR